MLYQEGKGRHFASDSSEKLTVGLLQHTSFVQFVEVFDQVQSRIEALRSNPDFRKFDENLRMSGYFREEREGSQLWKTLYEKAALAFIEARRDECAEAYGYAQMDIDIHIQ